VGDAHKSKNKSHVRKTALPPQPALLVQKINGVLKFISRLLQKINFTNPAIL
jgi:hypothetical protein